LLGELLPGLLCYLGLPGLADVRVDLRGVGGTVPEEILDDTQVGAAIEEVRSEGVAEEVRVDILGDAG
jgi:hypothetical protein